MKRAFALIPALALLAGCATYDDDHEHSGSSGTVIQQESGYGSGAPTRNQEDVERGQSDIGEEVVAPNERDLDQLDESDNSDGDVEFKGEIE